VIGKADFHGGSNSEGLMNLAKTVMNGVQNNRVARVVHLLAKPVGQSGDRRIVMRIVPDRSRTINAWRKEGKNCMLWL